MIRLDENHLYWYGSRRAPGFSEICKSMRVGEPDCADCLSGVGHYHNGNFWTEEGRNQGTALHWWLLFLAQGKKSDKEPEPEIAGRVEGIRKFLRDEKLKLIDGEKPQYDPVLNFACTPDIWGWMNGGIWNLDGKRGGKLNIHKLQTAAQKIALKANGVPVSNRGSLYLSDGDYRVKEHADYLDEIRWRAIVSAYHAKGVYKND